MQTRFEIIFLLAFYYNKHGIYVWQSITEPPNLYPPIFLQWRFWAQPPNLIAANISGYTVLLIPLSQYYLLLPSFP